MQKKLIKACAKINFGLNIIRKRSDNYHDIETIFYPVSLSDEITIGLSNELNFRTNSDFLSNEKENLVLKAVRVLEDHTSKKLPVDIYLKKNIPIGAGLGGGSSDAAAVLKAVNEIYALGLVNNTLRELALEIGSDAPFFVDPKPVFASSRGEIMEEIDFKIHAPLLLVNPGIHSSTKEAYSYITPAKPDINLKSNIKSIHNLIDYKLFIFNDFEPFITSKYNRLALLKKEMYSQGALFALMSGSGSTFFGIYPDLEHAVKAEAYFREQGNFTFLQS